MIWVGCCGLPEGLEKYAKRFKVLEINSTFYKLPKLETAERWRKKVPEDFKFSVKCHQGVTHPIKSPTWRRSGLKPEELERLEGKVGFLRPTREVLNFWEKTMEICKVLGAEICLIQLPRSFKESEENLQNLKEFFSKAKRDGLKIALELRGWDLEAFRRICKELDLIQVTDPFLQMPSYIKDIVYFRLHGSYEKGRINYKHKYSEKELKELKEKLEGLEAKDIYVMFNNVYMKEDALRFKELIGTA